MSDSIKITIVAASVPVPEFPSQLGFSLVLSMAVLGMAVMRKRMEPSI